MKINLPLETRVIIERLESCGFQAYCVGGCVRDSLLCLPVYDWDICTEAKPEEVQRIFSDYDMFLAGLKHGTVSLCREGEVHEVTTFRREGDYGDGRHPDSVEFVGSLEEDLSRRDFTVNAMAYSEKTGLVDPFGGLADLKAGVIKAVGQAEKRFSEDGLRIMRALRFSSKLGFSIEEETERAMYSLVDMLGSISRERINAEFCKLLQGRDAEWVLRKYSQVVFACLPQLEPMLGFQQLNRHHRYDVWEHSLVCFGHAPSDDLVLRLGALFHDVGKPETFSVDAEGVGHFYGHGSRGAEIVREMMNGLRFDKETTGRVVRLVKYHDGVILPEKKYVKRWLGKLGTEDFQRLLTLKRCDMLAQSEYQRAEKEQALAAVCGAYQEVLAGKECFSLADLAVNGRDLIDAGFEPGPELGAVLAQLLEAVIDGQLENSREQLLAAAGGFSGCDGGSE